MTEPTDAELIAELEAAGVVFMAFRGGLSGTKELWTTSGSQDAKKIAAGMRAAIAKWGTPPAVAGEPVAYLHDDGYWTAAKTDAGRNLNDRLLFAGSPKVAVYTTPQPTQAQAGAVPLSIAEVEQMLAQWDYEMHGDRARYIEAASGIKGGKP